jgi:hypothetical protein
MLYRCADNGMGRAMVAMAAMAASVAEAEGADADGKF